MKAFIAGLVGFEPKEGKRVQSFQLFFSMSILQHKDMDRQRVKR